MRIAIVGPVHPLRGGIAQYTTSLYQALAPGHELFLVSFSRQYPGLLFPGKTQIDSSSTPFTAPGEHLLDTLSPLSWVKAGRRVAEFSPEVVVFQWWRPFFTPVYQSMIRRIRNSIRVPVIFLCHNILSHEEVFFPGQQLLKRNLVKIAFMGVDGFMVHAEKMIETLQNLKPGAPVRRIFHPVYDFYNQWDQDIPLQEKSDVPILLFFGKIRKYKGLETLLQALELVKREMRFRAIVAGEFYVSSGRYKDLAKRLGIGDDIEWLDHYIPNDQVPGLFRRADLVVLPYRNATQSGVVPVAYQFDVPVIATRVGGLAEVIHDNQTGFLVPPGDAAELARKILEYFKLSRKEVFRKNIRNFRKRLSWNQVADTLVELATELRAASR